MSDNGDKLTIHLSSGTKDVRASVKGDASNEDFVEVQLAREDAPSHANGRSRTVFWIFSGIAVLIAVLFALLHHTHGDE